MIKHLRSTCQRNWLTGLVLALLLLDSGGAWAQIIVTEPFDAAWTTPAMLSTATTSGAWGDGGATGDQQWHRNDYTTGWTSASGSPGPTGVGGTGNYARFHSFNAVSGTSGSLISPTLDFSSYAASKVLTFSMINTSGTDVVRVQLSTDGGTTYGGVLGTFGVYSAFTSVTVNLGTTTSNTVKIKFTAISDLGSTDIGIDNFQISNAVLPSLCGTKAIGPSAGADYPSLTAAFAAAATNGLCGSLILELQPAYGSAVETFPLAYSSIPDASSVNTVTVRPQGGAVPAINLIITSSNATATFNINGGKYLIIDGRPGGSGTTVSGATATTDLIIANTSTSSIPLNFASDAQNNTVQHCQVKGVGSSMSYPDVNFSGITVSTGNSNNTIQYNNIGDGATSPAVLVYSGATLNASNTVKNNNLFNFYYSGTTLAAAVYLSSAGADWIISNNSLYQTASRTPGASTTQYGIYLVSGTNALVSGNAIGGTAPATIPGNGAPTLSGTWTVSSTAASYRFVGIYASGSTPTVQNNTIGNMSWYSSSGATAAPGVWAGVYVLTTANVQGNTIGSGITVTTTTSGGISYGIVSSSGPTTLNVNGNTISGITVAGSTTSIANSVAGIQTGGTTNNIYQNKIYGLVAANAGVATGILSFAGTTTSIYNNLIGSLTAPASTSLLAVAGLSITAGTTVNAYHNTIYLNATSTGATFGTSGIFLNSTSTVLDLRGNIVVNASASAGTGGSAVALRRVSGTAATVPANYATTANNNLFYAGSPSATNLIYTEGTTTAINAQQTLAAYKAFMVSRDQASITENPTFVSTTGTLSTFLHINPTVATQVESGGAAISGITTDFDGDTRNATTPDVGADEGAFTPSDQSPPTITYTALGNTGSTANRTLTATITDASGIATAAGVPLLYFRKGTSGTYFSAGATSSAGSSYTFPLSSATLGGVVTGDVVQYYVAAQDASANNNVATNPSGGSAGTNPPGSTPPTTPNQYTILPTLSGNYYVGIGSHTPAATYATLTDAAAAYNSSGLNGAVNFVLIDATYPVLAAPVTFNGNRDASATNQLTIKPEAGVQPVITGSVSTALLVLNAASYVTLDGSNMGGASRDLTLTNTATTASTAVVWVESQGLSIGSANVVVKNLNLMGGSNTVANFGVFAGGTSISASSFGADNDNLTILNNSIQRVGYGIQVGGTTTVSAGGLDGLSIASNTMGAATAATATNIGFYGVRVLNSLAPSITDNTVQNVLPTNTTASAYGIAMSTGTTSATITGNTIKNISPSATGSTYGGFGLYMAATSGTVSIRNNSIQSVNAATSTYGIYLLDATATTVSQNVIQGITSSSYFATGLFLASNFLNGTVTRNKIASISSSGTGGYSGTGIDVETGSSTSNLVISNNFVQVTAASGYTTLSGPDTNAGIRIGTISTLSGGISLYYNSVNMTGTDPYNDADKSAALYVCAASTGLNIQNNIFTNIIFNSANNGARSYAFYSDAAASAFTAINFNDYSVSGSQGVLGYLGSDLPTLAALRTATTQDVNSLNVAPAFISVADLHASAPALNAAATPIVGATVDIDGDMRDASTPDIGADEFTPSVLDIKPTALVAPVAGQTCFGSAEAVTVTIQNNGSALLDFAANHATVTVNVTGAGAATLTRTITSGTLAAGATQSVVMGSLNMAAAGTYTFAATATIVGDQNTANDVLAPNPAITTVAPVAGTLSPTSATFCQSGTVTLVLAGAANGTIQYQSSPDGTTFTDVSGATSAAYTTPVLTSTTFFRAQTRCGVNSATSNVATITVNNPLITGTNTPVVICSGSSAALTATANSGSTIRWYDTNASTTILATGGAYATPVLTASRQYFVAAVSNGSTNTTGLPSNAATYGTYSQSGSLDYPLGFKVTQAGTLASVDVYPTAAGALTIRLYATASQPAAAGAQVGSDVTITVTAAQVATKVTIPLSISLAIGDYKLTNTVGAVGRFSTYSGAYPLSSGPVSVVGSYFASSSTTFSNISYNSFFNLAFTADCASSRTAVQVNVNPPATANAGTAPAGVCAGATYSTTGSFGGSATSATYTSSGSGAFSNGGVIDGTTPSVTYSPSAADITAGSVTLTLTTTGPCAAATSTLPLTINSTTYTGAATGDGNNWFNAANWTACVPSSTVDAVIPTGLTNYPNLSTTATAEVRSLALNNGASLTQSAGNLNVYGNLTSSTPAANVALTGGNVAFVGPMPTVTGLSSLYNLTVSLNSTAGTITLANNVAVAHALTLTQGTLTTGTYAVTLASAATLTETDASYVLGQVTVPGRNLSTATAETFGNIGLTLTPDAASAAFPGLTTVVRTTGTALAGAGSSVSVKRWFRVTPTVDANLTMTLEMDLFDHERNGIANGNLLLFSSPIPAGGSGSPATGTWAPYTASALVTPGNAAYATAVAISGLTHLSDWTLGNRANPLPVELANFTADRQGTNVALAWTTASEKNSRGFEVQASTDGRAFHVLDFVASATPLSTSPRYYAYLDREAGKTGTRYYRLRQIDLSGTATFSLVRTVRFNGELAVHFMAAPNPFQEHLTLTVELPAGTVAAPAQLNLTDAAGRTLLKQFVPALAAGLSQLELPDLAKLASGVYIVSLAVPGQPTQHLKVVKE